MEKNAFKLATLLNNWIRVAVPILTNIRKNRDRGLHLTISPTWDQAWIKEEK